VQRVLLAYTLDINEFRGRQSLQLMVRHLQAV
jgi:single-stranded-DNA-specific exonuclease